MSEEVKNKDDVSSLRKCVLERFVRKLDKYLPEDGHLRPWTLAEIEDSLLKDMCDISRDVIETRLEVDPKRVSDKRLRCPRCNSALSGRNDPINTHRQTLFGRVSVARSYGSCRSCGAAFSPSGQRLGLRAGLL